ncbi:DnaJ-domain-containing protein [Lentinula lateritia]|uniref:DnaJ-domain-containing protein n=1 Tax=Lentinula aff. lateritia TaxID=2804960 RepID=A0ACC1UBC5_9AGAR|nr:DnaJ-domain-containing protein [Lentinula aff. lateritia]KAJ3852047.1 DnaJ-domain-containing protein [Lentinula lateritia]
MSTSTSSNNAAAGPSSKASKGKRSPSPPTILDAELEKLLSREASAFQREVEVERILKAFKLNPYDILDLDETATQDDIKKKYRQLSLFIHPDKTPHPRAPDAFDILKKAESELSEKAKRDELDALLSQARTLLVREMGWSSMNNKAIKEIEAIWRERVRAKTKELLIDEELRRRKALQLALANEGLEARKKDEEVATRKRKADDDKAWEANREQRVDSWRSFANTSKKKKKGKSATLLG